jgi:uncharacterized protein YndB with AHSA1/START domain
MQNEIKKVFSFGQPPEEVWDYLTKPELLGQWLGDTDFQPVKGCKFQLNGKNGCVNLCEVIEVIPNRHLSYSWKVEGSDGNLTMDSTVVWTLHEQNGGTELHLIHHGFMSEDEFLGKQSGWTILGNRLVEIFNTVKQ